MKTMGFSEIIEDVDLKSGTCHFLTLAQGHLHTCIKIKTCFFTGPFSTKLCI